MIELRFYILEFLEQCCSIEFSAMIEMFYTCVVSMVAASQIWLLSPWDVTSEELNWGIWILDSVSALPSMVATKHMWLF